MTTPVDLMGRLSNPPEQLKHLVERDAAKPKRDKKCPSLRPRVVATAATRASSEETGRLSNPTPRPVQRRLGRAEIDTIISNYQAGHSLRAIAKLLGIHHHTIAAHLQRHGIARRLNQREMTDIVETSRRYAAGDSLAAATDRKTVQSPTGSRTQLTLHGADVKRAAAKGVV